MLCTYEVGRYLGILHFVSCLCSSVSSSVALYVAYVGSTPGLGVSNVNVEKETMKMQKKVEINNDNNKIKGRRSR